MAKYDLRLKAREMRSAGESVKKIAQNLGIAKSTVSIWVRDIILSVEQLESLKNNSIKGAERGRLLSAFMQKERRHKLMEDSYLDGKEYLGKISDREFLIAGLALYWGEGSKKSRNLRINNSDPKMLVFMLNWFRKFFSIKNDDIRLIVGINVIHKKRDKIVRKYWSDITGVPLNYFRKTSFKKINNKKVYSNYDQYFGVLTIDVLKPTRFYYKIIGLIEALATPG